MRLKSPEKEGVGRGPWCEGKGHRLGGEEGRGKERKARTAHQPLLPLPRSTPARPGAEKPRAPHLPLLLASSESRSLNYG